MYIPNITDDHNDTFSKFINCTNNDNIIEIIIQIFPCGLSLICLIFLMVYTLMKPFIQY